MKASEMTNEELVSVLAEIPCKSWHDLDRETVHDMCREAAARLRKADADVAFANACADETGDDCDAALVASEAEVSDLRLGSRSPRTR